MLNRTSRKLEVQPDLARKVIAGQARAHDDPRRLLLLRGGRQHGYAGAHGGREAARRASTRCSTRPTRCPASGEEPETDPSEPRGLIARLGGERGQGTRRDDGPAAGARRSSCSRSGRSGCSATPTCSPATPRARGRASSPSTRSTPRRTKPYRDAARGGPPEGVAQGRRDRDRQEGPGHRQRASLKVPIVLPGLNSPWTVSDHASTSVEDEPLPPSQTDDDPEQVVRRRLADERGQASAELMGMMVWLMLVTLIVWQVCLAAWTYTQVSNAARTGQPGRGRAAATPRRRPATRSPGRCGRTIERITISGEKATVKVRMPLRRARAHHSKQADRHPLRGAARADGPARPHRGRGRRHPRQRRRRRRRRRLLLPQAPARGGQPLGDRRAVRAAAPRAARARGRPHGLPRGPGALDRRALAADPARDRRGDRPRRAGAAARRPVDDRDHGQRARRGLPRARGPARAAPTSPSPTRRSSTRRSTASSRRSTGASTSPARWSTPACPPASAST